MVSASSSSSESTLRRCAGTLQTSTHSSAMREIHGRAPMRRAVCKRRAEMLLRGVRASERCRKMAEAQRHRAHPPQAEHAPVPATFPVRQEALVGELARARDYRAARYSPGSTNAPISEKRIMLRR